MSSRKQKCTHSTEEGVKIYEEGIKNGMKGDYSNPAGWFNLSPGCLDMTKSEYEARWIKYLKNRKPSINTNTMATTPKKKVSRKKKTVTMQTCERCNKYPCMCTVTTSVKKKASAKKTTMSTKMTTILTADTNDGVRQYRTKENGVRQYLKPIIVHRWTNC
jgi:hypothetical protein